MVKHKAHTYKFNDLINLLEAEVSEGYINKIQSKKFPELVIYDYARECMTENHWSEACRLARGLVINTKEKRIQATPFIKFFNLSEGKVKVSSKDSFEVFEKLDGSLGIVYFHDDEWRVNTRGSFESDQAIWAKEFFDKHIVTSNLNHGATYLVEIIYPENRVCVNYEGKELLGLMGGYDENGNELSLNEVTEHFNIPKEGNEFIRPAKTYTGKTIDDLIYLAENELDMNDEGFIVRFNDGDRVKIKSAAYVAMHKVLSHFSKRAVYDFFAEHPSANPFSDDCFSNLPEEFFIDFCSFYSEVSTLFNIWIAEGIKFTKKNINLDNKSVGVMMKEGKVSKRVANTFFAIRNRKISSLYENSVERKRIVKQIYEETSSPKTK